MDLGSRIRDLRSRKKVMLGELAKRSGLTSSFLSQVERNITSPSISSLRRIAMALDTKVGYFFEEEVEEKLVFIRKARRKKFIDKKLKSYCEILVSGLLNIMMEPLLFTLKVGGKAERDGVSRQGEEFGIVLKGKVELLRDKKKFIMEEGDSIYFKSSKPHKMVNIDDVEARILWVIYIPSG